MKKEIAVVDLFAGAGGLSEGFHKHHYKMIAYIEKDISACDTLLTRHIYWQLEKQGKRNVYLDYLRGNIKKETYYNYLDGLNPIINAEISSETMPRIISRIRENMRSFHIQEIDLFIGGPPCQAYSLIGRARDKYKMEKDHRNILYKYYVELLKEFQPRVFVFENVPGILTAGSGKLFQDICLLFENAGYTIENRMLDSSEFNVLQKRQRIILIGWKKELALQYPEFEKNTHTYTVNDVFHDLPFLKAGEKIDRGEYRKESPSGYLLKMGIRKHDDILTLHITRPLIPNDREIYLRAIRLWNKDRRRLHYDDLPDSLKTHKNRESFKDRFKVVAADLPYSHTIVAHLSKDGHYYIHPDEEQLRSISVREAARLQSFSDDFYFEGSRTSIFRQIGNAVPPLMGELIAKKIKEMVL